MKDVWSVYWVRTGGPEVPDFIFNLGLGMRPNLKIRGIYSVFSRGEL